ncbi:tetratricopeptide repeat protein [Aquibium sp. ELW1220]|uniref:tetratricopeptide repeat protein n=1 Tax=Aquibium sp. ELW1220 TaxID=2976766 RepID=UPI0025B0D0D7|nr:tetratricopeptide repeat protein [Aquibium sp. ELW1220]MDN2579937.1 tetratricopeptide repeat protein [Aquibium sp. ELW1220]
MERVLFGDGPAFAEWRAEFRTTPRVKRGKVPPATASGRPSSPHKPRNLPFASLGSLFKGRSNELARLQAALSGGGSNGIAIAGHALHGLGGIGKTQLAIEFAHAHNEDYRALLFLPCGSKELLASALAALAGPDVLDLPEQHETDDARRANAALRWLNANPGWLLILDNVDDEAALAAMEALRPRLRGGSVLITGRLNAWPAGVASIELDVLDPDSATAFVLDRTEGARRRTPDDGARAADIARELDGLALALAQAAAYVCVSRISLGQYLERWRSRRDEVATWFDRSLVSYNHDVGFAATWATSVERLSDAARALLERLAFMAPEPIPDVLFDAADASESRDELMRYSLVTRTDLSGGTLPGVGMHRLVQQQSRSAMPSGRRGAALEETLDWLVPVFVSGSMTGEALPLLTLLAPHAEAVISHVDASAGPFDTGRRRKLLILHGTLGDVHANRGNLRQAAVDFDRAVRDAERLVDIDPANTDWQRDLFVSLTRIGDAERRLGNGDAALNAHRKGLAIAEALNLRDPANPEWQRDLSVSLTKIGDVELRLGNGDAALDAYRKGLAIRAALSHRDPANTQWQRDLFVSLNRIGDVELQFGNGDAALEAYRNGLAIAEALALCDPANTEWQRDLSVSLNKIGDVERRLGNGDTALDAYRKGLAIREALALRDPANTQWQRNLSISLNRIGDVELRLGNGDAALDAYRKGLAIRAALALRDPANTQWQRDLSVSLNRIGDVELRLGKDDAALDAYRKGLAIREALARRDPANTQWQRDLSISLNNIGDVECRRGNGDAALDAFRKGLAIGEALALRDPANTDWQRDLIISNVKLAEAGDRPADRLRAALAIAEALQDAGRLAPADGGMIDELKRRLAEDDG